MAEINETQSGFEVSAVAYRQTFASKFKAIMAAHAVAMKEAVPCGEPVHVMSCMRDVQSPM
jgi:hypothetical protein